MKKIVALILLLGFIFKDNIFPSDPKSQKTPPQSKSQQRAIQEPDKETPKELFQESPSEFLPSDPELLRMAEEKKKRGRVNDLTTLQNAILAAHEKWGPGAELRTAIINLFRDCNVPLQDLVSFLNNSSDHTVTGHAFTGIILRFNDPSLKNLNDAGDISGLIHANFHGMTFGNILNSYLQSSGNKDTRIARLDEAFQILENANFDSTPLLVPEVLKSLALNFPAEGTAELLDKLIASKFNFLENEEIQQPILDSLKNESALVALDYLANKSEVTEDAKWSLSHNAMHFSITSLKSYVESNPQDLVAKAVYAKHLLKQGYPDTLKHLLHEEGFGESSKFGKNLGGQLWSYEARIVSAEAKKNPEKVVLDMARGTSQFDNLHLVTAVNEWMRADSEAAAQWVETEGVNLPPEDRQFVAISYAREAANQGNIELAKQWADLILDENRKARVMNHISSKL